VSMGMWGALKLQQVLANTQHILAIELLAAAQGIDLLRPLTSSAQLERVHGALRERVPEWTEDREMTPDINIALAFLEEIDPLLEGLR
ncbi:MAG: aromatic amino acid lyase, partial [Acidiferrobacterales bacterium]